MKGAKRMVKTQNVDTELLDNAINRSGLKIGFIVEQLGISRQAFDQKRKGNTCFRKSEVYVLKSLLNLTDEETIKIFFPES